MLASNRNFPRPQPLLLRALDVSKAFCEVRYCALSELLAFTRARHLHVQIKRGAVSRLSKHLFGNVEFGAGAHTACAEAMFQAT